MDAVLDEILAELDERDPECVKCFALMASEYQWARTTQAERDELRADGYARPGRRGLCSSCYNRAKTAGTLEQYAPGKAGRPVAA